MKKETIFFDLGGVYFTDGTKEAISKISKEYGINRQLVFEVFRGEIGSEYRKGNISRSEFCARAKEHWKRSDILQERISDIWLSGYKPIQGTVEIIERLRLSGYRVFFLSGNAPDRVKYLDSKYHFLSKFDGGIFSYKVKISKTNVDIYKLALNETDTLAENCIYIDDKMDILLLAKKLGISIIYFKSPASLQEELLKMGLKF